MFRNREMFSMAAAQRDRIKRDNHLKLREQFMNKVIAKRRIQCLADSVEAQLGRELRQELPDQFGGYSESYAGYQMYTVLYVG